MRDALNKGRFAVGERDGMAKLTRDQVVELRAMRRSTGMPFAEIGAIFGISRRQAARIFRGQRWAHVALDDCA